MMSCKPEITITAQMGHRVILQWQQQEMERINRFNTNMYSGNENKYNFALSKQN